MKNTNFCLYWKKAKKRGTIFILCIVLLLNYSWAQTPANYHNTPNPDSKTVITVSASQMPMTQSLPLEYDASTTRMVATMPSPMNETGDTLLPDNTGQRWNTTLGTHNHYDGVYDLLEDYDKGYYLIAYDVLNGDSGNGWNIKTDINGNLLYDNKLKNTEAQYIGWCGYNDSAGNKYIAGVAFLDLPWPFLIKFNACGEKVWCSLLKHWDFLLGSPSDMLINDDGNILILTRFESEEQINQIFLLCYSPEGELLWSKPYASKTEHPLISFAYGTKLYHFGEDYIISGYCYYPYPDNPNHVWMRPLFIGIDSLFNEKWILPFGVTDSIVGKAYSAIPLNDSVIMGVGYNVVEQSGYYGRASTMMFFNHNGEELGFTEIQRDSIIPGTKGNTLIEIETISDSLFIATAVFGPSTVFNPFGEMVIDTSGKVYNAVSRPNTIGVLSLLRKTFDNKYVIACGIYETDMDHTDIYLYKINANLEQDTLYTQNFVYDSLCPDPIVSGDIDMTNCSVVLVSIGEAPTPEEYYKDLNTIPVKVYPNPSEDCISFDYKNTDRHQNIHLNCYDINGQKIYSENISTGQQGSKINVSSWGSGVYMAIISSEGVIVGKARFIVK
jgi:hypothetical protein